jgi:multiple sugar transport system permease protein
MRRFSREAILVLLAIPILLWTLLPIYHIFLFSISSKDSAFSGALWPDQPTLRNFGTIVREEHFYLHHFWSQIWNSLWIAVAVGVITLAVATCAAFAISRLKVRGGRAVMNLALFTYFIPAAFLAIPMYKAMGMYGLLNNRWSLVLAMVTLAAPYAIWVLKQASDKLPYELDEAAKIDGATPLQLFRLVYLPLMTPSLIAIGTYALLLAWNEYLYAFLLLSTEKQATIPVAMGYFLVTDDAPWTLLMATAIIYSLPPAALYYAVRKYMVSGLTAGATKA